MVLKGVYMQSLAPSFTRASSLLGSTPSISNHSTYPSGRNDCRFSCLRSSTLCSVQPGNLLRGQAPLFQGPNAPLCLPTSGHC